MGDGYDRGPGSKRRRDEEEDGSSRGRGVQSVLASAIRLCNKPQGDEEHVSAKEQLENLQRSITRELQSHSTKFIRIILDCAVEFSHKAPAYAALIGLLNTEEDAFVTQLLNTASKEINDALATGDRHRFRLLLRFLVALVPCNVLYASSVLKALQAIVASANHIAEQGKEGEKHRQWQPYTDFLVYSVLFALPWGGQYLAETSEELATLLEEAEKYMRLRPVSHTTALQPFFEGSDAASVSDSGAASFLGQVWEAIQELQSTGSWKVESVPQVISQLDEAQLATGKPHDVGEIVVPTQAPCLSKKAQAPDMEAAALVLAAFPPRGVIRLLPAENTWGDKRKIERLIAEEYILDTIHYFDGDRVMCARTLASGLPLTGKLEPLITETIFSQILRVPAPQFKPIAYATVLADVCRLLQAVPRSMSACVRELFQRMAALDPQLRTQLADWLAYHLSNFDFMWPWAKWSYVLQAAPYDAQRRFVVDVFSKLIRLSYYSNILSKVPENYKEIFPPKPEPQSLEDAVENGTGEPDGQPSANGAAPTHHASASERKWAREFVQKIKEKKSTEECLEWIKESGMEQELGDTVGVLRALLRGQLIAGSKSFTHMLIALERYESLLVKLLPEAGDQGREALVSTAADVWRDAPQRAAQAIDRLMAQRLVDSANIVHWAFTWRGLLSLSNQIQNGLAWEVLYNAVNKTLARTQDAQDEVAEAELANKAFNQEHSTEASEGAMLGVVDDREVQANDALKEKQKHLAAALQEQHDTLKLCLRMFKEILAQDPTDGSDELEARQEWHRYTLAQLRAFTRRFHAHLAPIAKELENDLFALDATDSKIREAFLQSLQI